ncbi:hypothetical protein ACLKA6_012766 [Drosophila palustris]
MIYPRLFHRHIAITALYLLLTLGVLGLIIILCTFNDTEHTYLFKSGSSNTPSPIPTLKLNNISNWSEKSAAFPFWTATQSKTRRIIGNERKSAERSRQLLLCEKGKSGGGGGGGGGELCRMLFKET